MAGVAGEGFAEVLGVHRLVELAFDAHRLAGVAVLAFTQAVLGVGLVGVFVVAVAVALGTGHLAVVGRRVGVQMNQVATQLLEIQPFLRGLLEPCFRVAGQAFSVGCLDFYEFFGGRW